MLSAEILREPREDHAEADKNVSNWELATFIVYLILSIFSIDCMRQLPSIYAKH